MNNSKLQKELFSAKRVLFIGAHPDDIEFYCAGLIYLMRKQNIEVIYAIATRGGKGYKQPFRAYLEKLRTQHQKKSANILGGAEVILYNYPDKNLQTYIEPYANDLKQLIAEKNPDIILSWDPDYIYNPHPDHQAAAQAGKIAGTGTKTCYYGTLNPNLWIGYDEETFQIKIKSLKAHRTETPWPYFTRIKKALLERQLNEGAKTGSKYAEVFRLHL